MMPLKILKNSSKNKEKKYIKKTDYEKFGRYMSEVYETGYFDRGRMFRYAFIKGIFSGLGGIIGATIVFALLLWVLSFFDSIPLVGNFVQQVESSVETTQGL